MKTLIVLLTFFVMPTGVILFEFNSKCDINNWFITNDVVMGGVSSSTIRLDEQGNGVFSGTVSTENNGGFAMTRCDVNATVKDAKYVEIKLKGDGKTYQFRIKSANDNRFWYVATFETSGEWEIIRLPLESFEQRFRGRTLDLPNFKEASISEIAFLIGNKRTEEFELKLASIHLK